MKILHITTSIGGGGRERRMAQLVWGLHREGITQEIVLVGDANMRQDYEVPKEVRMKNACGYGSRFRLFINVNNAIRDFNPDIVHVWTEIPTLLTTITILKLLGGFKLVTGFLADGNSIHSKWKRLMYKYNFAVSDAIVSNSMSGIKAKRAPRSKSRVIYNGFDFSRFDKDTADLQFNNDVKDKLVISMFARFSNAKNWKMFVDVASHFKSIRTIEFLAVGSGDNLNEVKRYADDLQVTNIKFLGQRKDVENLMKISDITLLFSNADVHAEGVSNSIMESMAAGVPVIATDGGGTPEIITHGVDGFVIPPNDVTAAVKTINCMISHKDLLLSMGKKAVQTVKSRFTLDGMTKQYIELYKSL